MNFFALARILPYKFDSDHELLQSIAQLSRSFNSRDQLAQYLRDDRLCSAYCLFYMLSNIPRMQNILQLLPDPLKQKIFHSDILDIGCGPGTLFWSLLSNNSQLRLSAVGIDQSPLMREIAELIYSEFYKDSSITFYNEFDVISKKPSALFFTHSLNEMGYEEAQKYVIKYQPEDILFIEPGTQQSFAEIKKMRQFLIEKQYQIIHPCPNTMACPMPSSDWCHQIVYSSLDPEVERLSQKLKIDRKKGSYIFHYYQLLEKDDVPHGKARIIRDYGKNKHALNWQLCLVDLQQQVLTLQDAEVPKKEIDKELWKIANHSGRGLDYTLIKLLGDGRQRISLKSKN